MRKIFTSSPSPFEELQRIIKGEVKSSQEKNVWFFPQSTENCVEAKIFQISHVEGFSYHHFIQPRYHHNHHHVLARQNLLFQLIAEFPRLENGEKDWKFSLSSLEHPPTESIKSARCENSIFVSKQRKSELIEKVKKNRASSLCLMSYECTRVSTEREGSRSADGVGSWGVKKEKSVYIIPTPLTLSYIFSHMIVHMLRILNREINFRLQNDVRGGRGCRAECFEKGK